MPSEKLIAKKENGVGWITLNNPERHNAISLDMWTAAMEALVVDRVHRAFDVEQRDRLAVHLDALTGAGRDVRERADPDELGHDPPPPAIA